MSNSASNSSPFPPPVPVPESDDPPIIVPAVPIPEEDPVPEVVGLGKTETGSPTTSNDDTIPFGIEVTSSEPPAEAAGNQNHAIVIKIHMVPFLKDLREWMRKYRVGKTIKELGKQVHWNDQFWKPLKEWMKSIRWREEVWEPCKEGLKDVDWKQDVCDPVKNELDEVDWDEVKSEAKKGLEEADWEQVKQEIKEGIASVDWKEVRREWNDATRDNIDWNGIQTEIKEGLKEAVDWKVIQHTVKEATTSIRDNIMVEEESLTKFEEKAKEVLPDDLVEDGKKLWGSISSLFQEEEEKEPSACDTKAPENQKKE